MIPVSPEEIQTAKQRPRRKPGALLLGVYGLKAVEHGAVDVRDAVGAAHGHGVAELRLELVHVGLDALGAAAVDHVDEGPADQNAVGAQSQGLEHVHAGADAAVHQDGQLAAHRVHDAGQDLGGGGALVQHPAAVVGDHDALGAGHQGLLGAPDGHDALEDKGLAGHLHHVAQLRHGLAAGGRGQVLQEGQARGVDVHGDGEGIRLPGQGQLGFQGVHVPGLDGGHAVAAAGGDGLHGALHHGGVGAVAGEGGDAGLGAGGHQDLVVL